MDGSEEGGEESGPGVAAGYGSARDTEPMGWLDAR